MNKKINNININKVINNNTNSSNYNNNAPKINNNNNSPKINNNNNTPKINNNNNNGPKINNNNNGPKKNSPKYSKNNNVNTAVKNIKNNSFSNTIKEHKNTLFILGIVVILIIVGIAGYYIYKQYPEVLQLNNIENEIESVLGLKENNNQMNNNQKMNTNSNLLTNIKNNTYNTGGKQVFNISNNIFSYDDAEAVCQAHNSELASYEQVVDAHKKGAEWCNYGWSKKQMALFPMQENTIKKIQQDPESANMCGSTGVNGGYFENRDTLFGVNCYGMKPEPKDRERVKPVPVSNRQRNILDKVKRFKENKNDITINPFNNDLWSQR